MEPLKVYPVEVEIGSSMESFQKFLESQKSLFHSQIGHLQNVVATQCKLTGVNPLSQEMAAGALFVKIGKRPRDLLNPKAVNYLHSVFSIKDAVSKKEIRDISARFGMTATQVKEYFTNQRSRVRRLVRLSREKAIFNGFSMGIQDEAPLSSEIPVDPDPLCRIAPPKIEEPLPCSNQNEVFPDIADSDKNFVDNIFSLMRNEDTFTGQVKLMEWILQIKNPFVHCWFLTRGGLMILATWLSQAASEEQTSVLYVVLKVLTFLPLSKALPVHMSAIIQSVNRLRFYGKAGSKGSAVLLEQNVWQKPSYQKTEWSKAFKICELMSDELEQHAADMPEDARNGSLDETSFVVRRLESPHAIKLLTASADDSNKRLVLGIPTHKERRKVLLVEQPGQKTLGKNQQVVKVVNASTHARPITADEIQKAKLRAQYMQSKHEKAGSPSKDSGKSKSNDSKTPSSLLTNDLLSASEAYLRPKLEAHKKAKLLPHKNTKRMEKVSEQKPSSVTEKKLAEIPKRVRIPWHVPPEMTIDPGWKLCSGDKSKEGEAQRNRISREKESMYRTREEVPLNPKEPWDVEMDYDDSLTPEIPLEQLPETDTGSISISNSNSSGDGGVPLEQLPSAQPDLELLAVLLKNPELVFALTSGSGSVGQSAAGGGGSGLSNTDTVRLLDLLKHNPGVLSNNNPHAASLPSPTPNSRLDISLPSPTPAAAAAATTTTCFDVSLPSPTPAINAAPSGWRRQETLKNPFSRQSATSLQNHHQYQASEVMAMASSVEQHPSSSSWPHHQFQQHNMVQKSQQPGGWGGHGIGHSSESSRNHQERGQGVNPVGWAHHQGQGGRQDRGAWRRQDDLTGFTDQGVWNNTSRRWSNQDRSRR
ncbi:hypothetical protein V2J09_021219 [Rumex salicifolius]